MASVFDKALDGQGNNGQSLLGKKLATILGASLRKRSDVANSVNTAVASLPANVPKTLGNIGVDR